MTASVLIPPIAAAGGGSSGFGGGGGGGGSFGGGGFGGGGGGGVGVGGGGSIVIVLLVIAVVLVLFVLGAIQTLRYRRKRHARVAAVELAAAEAAEDDPRFAKDTVLSAAMALFTTMQEAWDDRDRDRLATLCNQDLLVEWTRRLDDFDRRGWHNRVRVLGAPTIEYVGLVNREGTDNDRVVVRIEATLEDYVELRNGGRLNQSGRTSAATALAEYWTLGLHDDHWILLSIEQKAEGDHQLDAEIVASPWADSRVADAALLETAVADAPGDEISTADIADLDFDGDGRAAALDLSLADPRFSPDVLEVAVRRAVAAWAEAVDGPDAALEGIATPDAIGALLHPGSADGQTRLVVRGPVVEQVRILALDAAHEPPTMTVDVTVRGARYVEDRDTVAVVSGSRNRVVRFTERWTFGLGSDRADQPWRIVDASGARVLA